PTIWRYAELLPVSPGAERVDMGAGYTPLVKANNLGRILGLKELYIKNDTQNPTFSFKDRVVSVALTKAREFGYKIAACASTGNLANSVAAHAAWAGMDSYVFIPADLEKGKIISTAIYGPNLVAVNGNYDEVNRLCAEIASEYDWAFVNVNIRPYYAEGSKSIAFETVEQLGWRAPDHVVVPIASGSLLTKVKKGFDEMQKIGLIDEVNTRISGAQAEGCSPVANAFAEGIDIIKPVKPKTIAKSLAIGNPADGFYALRVVNESDGEIAAVSDTEIIEAMKLLAETEGIFTETAGGVTIGVLKKLAEAGKIKPDETTVAYMTGLGLKTLEALEPQLGPTATIQPGFKDFQEAFDLKKS
ncbi:MAG: threonine synthase, partial [Actinomycetia bacterium]|nr:threonine synthase [Actinomycetes bacterium]